MAIGVNGNSNQIDLQKLMQLRMNGKTGRTGATKKAPGMSMNESIFSKNAQMVSGQNNTAAKAGQTNTADNVANVNTAKSIDGIKKSENTKGADKTEGTQGQQQDKPELNIGNIDFDNLGTLSTSELHEVKHQLKDILNNDVPLFLTKPFEQKLDKVNAEIQNRNEQEGNKLSEDNLKAEEKQKKSIEEQNDDAKKDSAASASDGKAATRQTEQGTATINKTSADMKDQASDTKAAEKKMKSDMAKGQKLLDKNEKKMMSATNDINNLSEENEQINAEIEGLSGQIETLGENADQSEIESLTQRITAKGQTVEANQNNIGKKAVTIKKFQASSGQTIRRLTKSSQKFTKTMVRNQKAAAASQQEQSKVLDIANKADEISGYVATTGQMTQYVGKGMIALGSAMITGGQALISAGMVTEKIGIGVETVGNYGKMAANITKTAVYAAEGNIMGAVMSAGSAVMSGASAVKGTKEMAGGFQSVNKEGAKAAQKLQDKTADKAKEASEKASQLAANGGNADKIAGLKDKAATLEKKAGDIGQFKDGIQGKIDTHNNKMLDKAINKASKHADKTEFNNLKAMRDDVANNSGAGKRVAQDSVNKWAEESEKKFASKMEKAMQFGSFAMTAASQMGVMNQGGSAGAVRTVGHGMTQHSNRRRIA
ncbi:hypothetical protein J6O86_07075 [bacterium]|nr:hypothetical protein [bacterium]